MLFLNRGKGRKLQEAIRKVSHTLLSRVTLATRRPLSCSITRLLTYALNRLCRRCERIYDVLRKATCLTRPCKFIFFSPFLSRSLEVSFRDNLCIWRHKREPSKVCVRKKTVRVEKKRIDEAQLEKRRRKLFFFAIRTSRRKAKFEAWPTSLRCLLKWQTRPQNLIKLVNPSAPSSTSTTVVASPSTYLPRSTRYKQRRGQSETSNASCIPCTRRVHDRYLHFHFALKKI